MKIYKIIVPLLHLNADPIRFDERAEKLAKTAKKKNILVLKCTIKKQVCKKEIKNSKGAIRLILDVFGTNSV